MKSNLVAKLFLLSVLSIQCHNIFGQNTLALEFISQAKAFSICENSSYVTLFVENKTGGSVFSPSFTAALPAGLQVLPGSCELSFPAGTPFQPLNDPTLQGNTAKWNLGANNSYLAQFGLGATLSDSRLWIRFKLEMNCDYAPNQAIACQMRGEKLTGTPIISALVNSNPVLRTRTKFAIRDFDVRYTGGVAAYQVIVENLGDSSYVGLKLKFYHDKDDSGTLTAADEYQYTDVINFQIGPGLPIPLASGLPVDLSHICHLICVLEADENCLCENVAFPVDEITRTMYPTQHCSGSLVNVGVPETLGHTYDWSPDTLITCSDCAYPVFEFIEEVDTSVMFTYHYVETAGDCVLASDLDVVIHPAPEFGNYDDTICAGETAMLSVPGMESYFWSGPGITEPTKSMQSVSPNFTTSYNVTVANGSGCNTYGLITVFVKESPLADIIADTTTYCAGTKSDVLHPLFVHNYSYQWYPSQAFDNPLAVSPSATTSVAQYGYLKVSLPNGCFTKDSVWLNVQAAPDLKVSNSEVYLCEGQNAQLNVQGGNNYTWFPTTNLNCQNADCSSVQIVPDAQQAVSYWVSSQNAIGCADTVQVTIHAPVQEIQTQETLSVCRSEMPLMVLGQQINAATEICKTYTAVGGCDSTHCIQVTVSDPVIEQENYSLCEGDTLIIDGKIYTKAGVYCDTIQGAGRCDSIVCRTIKVHALPVLDPVYTNSVKQGGVVLLPLPTGYQSYMWTPAEFLSCSDCPIPSFSSVLAENITYDIYVESAPGCGRFTEYQVEVKADCSADNMAFPTAFTPDGDGINETFTSIKTPGALERIINLRIYNRWGNMVYEGQEWDGKDNGKNAPIGTYIWSAHVMCPNGKGDLIKGNISLLR